MVGDDEMNKNIKNITSNFDINVYSMNDKDLEEKLQKDIENYFS